MNAYVHEFDWRAPASVEKVFEALTTPEMLRRWFAEHAEIEARVGGAFRFWGRHTIKTPTKTQAAQSLTAYDAPHRLAFRWRFLDCDSEVALSLKAGDAKHETIVSGRHAFAQTPTIRRAKELIDDLWRLHGGNLVAFLKGGDGVLMPDYNDPSPEIRQSILIDAPREDVFKALITPEILATWIGGKNAIVEPKAGGAYSYGWRYEVGGKTVEGGPTRILDYVENEKLVTDWPDWRGDSSVPLQTITWLLADDGGKTRVTVIHSGFVRAVDFSDYPFGWGDFLQQLKKTAEAKG